MGLYGNDRQKTEDAVLSSMRNYYNKYAANIIMNDFLKFIPQGGSVTGRQKLLLAAYIFLVMSKKINLNAAKTQILPEISSNRFNTITKILNAIKEKGLAQVDDDSAIEGFVTQAIAANPKPVEEYKAGKTASIQFLVGQVMKLSRGKANPQAVLPLLKKHLDVG